MVKFPAAAEVPPIAGGEAKYAVKPAPETVLDAANVVKEPDEPLIAVPVIPPVAWNVPGAISVVGKDSVYVLPENATLI